MGKTCRNSHSGDGLPGFDLTVLANGTFSQLREPAGIDAQVTPYPWGALWCLLRDPDDAVGPVLRQWYRGAHQMLGLMPTGFHSFEEKQGAAAGPAVATRSKNAPWISLFWSLRADRMEALRAQPLEHWKQQVRSLSPQSESLLGQITSWDQVAWARYADVRCAKPFNGRVVCIGDAAHAMSPQLGQGCNMALIDALTLSSQPDQRSPMSGPLKSMPLHAGGIWPPISFSANG